MAVIQTQESNGLLNALGAIGTIGGAAFGLPWLSALGAGANLMNGGMGGGGTGGLGGLLQQPGIKDLLDKITGTWTNPASGSIAKTPYKTDAQINDEWQKSQILQNQNPYSRRGNAWELF